MADWYVSSVKYAALATFTASHAYNVGDIIKPTAPAVTAQYAYRCTTAGTSGTEPTWVQALGSTTTTGGATFTSIAGGNGSTYNWTGPAGNVASLTFSLPNNNAQAGDRIFVDSTHSESGAISDYNFGTSSGAWPEVKIISVNTAGSVPPVVADITSGAAIVNTSGSLTFDAYANLFWEGFTLTQNAAAQVFFNSAANKNYYFKNCAFVFGNTSNQCIISNNNPAKITFDNTTVQFDATTQGIRASYTFDFRWINTPSAIVGATVPSAIFLASNGQPSIITCQGVDLSAITGTLMAASSSGWNKVLLEGCKIASGVTRYGATLASTSGGDEIELINCYDGTNTLSERYSPSGKVTTSRSTYATGGAADDIGNFCLVMASNADSGEYCIPLETFWFDVENTLVGAAHTATIELVSSASLNNVDLHVLLEYQGTSGSPVSSFIDSLATPLTPSVAIPTSAQAWTSPPATPVYQHVQISFTPQNAGRVRAKVMLAKASTTVYVNPQVTIT